jgi:hypothetical protein
LATIYGSGVADRTEEDAIADALARVTDEQWAAVWEAAESVSTESEHATWRGGEIVGTTLVDGEERPVRQMPYPVYSDAVDRLRRCRTPGGPFDWMAWDRLSLYEGDAVCPGAGGRCSSVIRDDSR